MDESKNYRTSQESFWAGEFGDDYSNRNSSDQLLASNIRMFSTALRTAGAISSCLEIGANIGMNLAALRMLYPNLAIKAIEINPAAAQILSQRIGPENVHTASVLDYAGTEVFDLVLVKGVLIHINPEMLPIVYDQIYRAASRLVMIAEYYNPSPTAVPYRGHQDRLFKRDFAGEFLDTFPSYALKDYGFAYRRDPVFPQDDITWFLMERNY